MNFDPDNEADWEMAEMERRGRIIHRMAKKGVCLHLVRRGGDPENPHEQSKCLECGEVGTWAKLEETKGRLF